MLKNILNKDHERIWRTRSHGRKIGHNLPSKTREKVFKISKLNIPNIAFPDQHIDIGIPHGLSDHVIVLDIVKLRLTLTLNQQTRHVVL